eukprot:XP_024443090.1 uncharacterized protein LOC7458927 isoform X3 [Populus trichocarpa]
MEAARTKLTRVLSRTFINNVKDKAQRVMGSGSSFKGLAKYSTSAATVVKDYEDYRKSLYGDITHKALLVDAVGTLVVPSQPMAQIYRQMGEKYGVEYSEDEILRRYRWAYGQPWGRSRLRYVNDGRPFWQYIVSSSTGCSDTQYFEELYNYYTTEKVAAEKPNPTIFLKACELLEVKPEDAVHVGDDRRNDIWGARDAGCDSWLWGSDVHSFKEYLITRTSHNEMETGMQYLHGNWKSTPFILMVAQRIGVHV